MIFTSLIFSTIGSLYGLFCGSGFLLPVMASAVTLGVVRIVHFCFSYRGENDG